MKKTKIIMSVLAMICIFAGVSCKRSDSDYIASTEAFRTIYKQNGIYLDSNIPESKLRSRTGKFSADYDVSETVMEGDGIEYVYAKSDTDNSINKKLLYVVIKSDENKNLHAIIRFNKYPPV